MSETRDEHMLDVARFRSGTGFAARCSCGAKILNARGCNAPGLKYALANAQERHAEHVATLTEKPT